MLDVKKAVQIAREKSAEILGVDGNLGEIQHETYQGRDAWSINAGPAAKSRATFADFQVVSEAGSIEDLYH